jgi:FkbM family methyltransferase
MIQCSFLKAGDYQAEHILKTAVSFPEKLIIDGGSAMGVWSEKILSLGFRGLIYAFEPFARNNELLRERLGWNRNIVQFPCALFSRNQSVSFAIEKTVASASIAGYSSLGRIDGESPVTDAEQRFDVPGVRLDYAVGDHSVSLCKMDLQGGEREALKGAVNLLDRKRIDCLFLEFSGDKECIRILRDRDYSIFCTALTAIGNFDPKAFPGRILGRSKTTSGLPLVVYAHELGDLEDDAFVQLMRNFRRDHAYIQTDLVAVQKAMIPHYVPQCA